MAALLPSIRKNERGKSWGGRRPYRGFASRGKREGGRGASSYKREERLPLAQCPFSLKGRKRRGVRTRYFPSATYRKGGEEEGRKRGR